MALFASNPFLSAYFQSDWFGKGIFLSLFFLSMLCWILIFYKSWQFRSMKKLSAQFQTLFSEKKGRPLELQFFKPNFHRLSEIPNPLFEIYRSVKQQTLLLIEKSETPSLSLSDLEWIESSTLTAMSSAFKPIEKHLFILPTIVTLAPFLGLLGTVWGILLTFSQLGAGLQTSSAATLSGLSMALATTVLGLVVAIPALVAYSYLRNAGRDAKREMEEFSQTLLSAIELQYRRG